MGASLLGARGRWQHEHLLPHPAGHLLHQHLLPRDDRHRPGFLVSHISAADRKAAPNNGNKVMGWCVGLKTPGPWNFAQQDTNGIPGIQAGDLYVGMAPKCPNKNASVQGAVRHEPER